jgi:hypothetical protein
MKRFVIYLASTLAMVTVLFGQEFHDLKTFKSTFEGFGRMQEGTGFTLAQPAKAAVVGSTEVITLVDLEFKNLSHVEAELLVGFEVPFKPSQYAEVPGDYFITISFYDADMKCLLSESFVSEGGFTLAGVPQNASSNPPLQRLDAHHGIYKFTGRAQVPIHPAFLYGPNQTAGGIKPIQKFTIAAFHLGAG